MTIKVEPMYAWFVWTKKGRKPTFVHNNHDTAAKEAIRLAQLNPGQKFIVMRSAFKVHEEVIND